MKYAIAVLKHEINRLIQGTQGTSVSDAMKKVIEEIEKAIKILREVK